eukprot:8662783-Alexandrium_andersonii.AAC.1
MQCTTPCMGSNDQVRQGILDLAAGAFAGIAQTKCVEDLFHSLRQREVRDSDSKSLRLLRAWSIAAEAK